MPKKKTCQRSKSGSEDPPAAKRRVLGGTRTGPSLGYTFDPLWLPELGQGLARMVDEEVGMDLLLRGEDGPPVKGALFPHPRPSVRVLSCCVRLRRGLKE